jgi:hypothetical protein
MWVPLFYTISQAKDSFRCRATLLDSQRIYGEIEVLFDPFSFKKKDENQDTKG